MSSFAPQHFDRRLCGTAFATETAARAVAAVAVFALVLVAPLAPARAGEPARGDDFVLKFATVAPDGSPWARELQAFARNIESGTGGHVRVRWYLNAVAGDELEMGARLRRGELDGAASGQMLCEQMAPSMRASHVPTLFQSREEATFIMNRMQPDIEAEAHRAGMVLLATTGLGPSIFLLRTPVRSFSEMKKLRIWRWSADENGVAAARAMGLTIVPLPVHDAAGAYDRGQLDGFIGIPAAALAFQWSTQARFLVDLRPDYLWGCVLVAERSFARLPLEYQAIVREAAARVRERFEDVGRRVDEQLLGGLFQKQGVKLVPVNDQFRAEFFAAARQARERAADRFVSKELLARIQAMLADYRAEHGVNAKVRP